MRPRALQQGGGLAVLPIPAEVRPREVPTADREGEGGADRDPDQGVDGAEQDPPPDAARGVSVLRAPPEQLLLPIEALIGR